MVILAHYYNSCLGGLMKKGVFFCLSVCVGAGLLMSACTSSKKDGTYAYTQTDVEIPANGHVIPATLCIPDGSSRFPAVVMLHGTVTKPATDTAKPLPYWQKNTA